MRNRAAAGVVLSVLAASAAAQGLTDSEAALLPRVIDRACIDLTDAYIGCEHILLLTSEAEPDRADLIILPDRRDGASDPVLVARSVSFNGAMWGMAPSLGQSNAGALLLRSEQTGIGRFPWHQTLTIAEKEGIYQIIGFTYSAYDRAMGGAMSCDVNLITGDFVAEATRIDPETENIVTLHNEAGRTAPGMQPVATWYDIGAWPSPCSDASAAWAR